MKARQLAARLALNDAKKAAELFKQTDIDFQLVWVLNVAMIGIVFDCFRHDKNVLKASDIFDSAYKNIKDDNNSYKKMRNDLMHFYEDQYQGDDVFTPDVFEPGVFESREVTRGPHKGRHPAHVIWEAIARWEQVLDEVERELGYPPTIASTHS